MKTELRIASIGNVDSAKSTTISVIAKDILDDGRGLARKHILKHPHEITSGRTSSVSQYYIETDDSILGFIDLAGHKRYLKTTMCGLNGNFIDYVMVTIGADRGVIGMTIEHLTIAIALKLPVFIVITKFDIAIEHKLKKIKDRLTKIFSLPIAGNKRIRYVNNENIDSIINEYDYKSTFIPVFEVSNISGHNIDILRKFTYNLKKYKSVGNIDNQNPVFRIDDTFKLDGIGLILSGIVQEGIISTQDNLYIGPFNGEFIEVSVKSIHDNFKNSINYLQCGQSGCINIKPTNTKKKKLIRNMIKRGTVLIKSPFSIFKFDAVITILHHPTTIRENYEPVIHCGSVRQTARICHMDNELVRSGDSTNATFQFKFKPEFIELNQDIVFREGNTKGIGKVIKVY